MEQSNKRRRLSYCNTGMLLTNINNSTNTRSRLNDLTDDLLCEILLRVPDVKSLHRSKCVSKRWLSLLSAPSFARSFILFHNHPSAIQNMILFNVRHSSTTDLAQVYALPLHDSNSSLPLTFDFIPALRPDNYDHHYGLSPKGVTERVLTEMDLQGVCGGLVLLRGCFQDRTHDTPYYNSSPYYCYYVCNPLTKQWVELPLIPSLDVVGFVCYYPQQAEGEGPDSRVWAHATSRENIINQIENYDPNKIEFTVISVDKDEQQDVFIIRVLSSTDEIAEWNIFRVPFPPGYRWISTLLRTQVLFFNGKFHWCCKTGVAAYDPFNKPLQCDMIPFPFNECAGRILYLEVCEGHLRVISLEKTGEYAVWELVDYANKAWVKKFDVNINSDGHIGFQSFVGDAAPHQIYMVDYPSDVVMLYDVRKASLHHVYTLDLHDSDSLNFVQPFVSSPWPTPISLRGNK